MQVNVEKKGNKLYDLVVIPCDNNLPIGSLKSPLNYNIGCFDVNSPFIKVPIVRSVLVEDRHKVCASVDKVHVFAFCRKVLTEEVRLEAEEDNYGCNVRATTLAMACGRYGIRFYGDVYVVMTTTASFLGADEDDDSFNFDCSIFPEDLFVACHTPDVRRKIILELYDQFFGPPDTNSVPSWILQAPSINFHESSCLLLLQRAMRNTDGPEQPKISDQSGDNESLSKSTQNKTDFIDSLNATPTLCIQCRQPARSLCQKCKGAYFCDLPKPCVYKGWSHQCLCPTWKLYVDRREELTSFPFPWAKHLVGESMHTSETPYIAFLRDELKVLGRGWWLTETKGWSFGMGETSKLVDVSKRMTYQEGFVNLDPNLLPKEDCVNYHIATSLLGDAFKTQELLSLNSWEEYYKVRNIPLSSPVALLMTFPLTIYYAIQKYGEVPITVSRMLRRPLRVHVVGVEKELCFLDLFSEVGHLLPADFIVELTFISRADMLPMLSRDLFISSGIHGMEIELQPKNLKLTLARGTYGLDLCPDFDLGGRPDMIIGMNAGLYAYPSWSSVISYLREHEDVTAVFTDYNEYSGTNCASLGGLNGRETLCVNPFRQPRAMPVYSMNLPQISNGFMYVFNRKELGTDI